MKKRLLTIIGVVLMAAALFTVIHFIWSDLYISEFDSDNAETAMWAQATLESGKLADPDFLYYGMVIPVGGNLFFAPFVKAFGMSITTLRAGYTVSAVIFAVLLVLALRACLNSWDLAMIGCGLIMLLTTATESLRSIIWAHTVYYGLSIFFILMCFCSLSLYLRGKRIAGGILFFLSAMLCSINGNVILLYTALPLAAALFLELLSQEHPGESFMKGPLLLICAAIVLGFGLNKWITAGISTPYTDNYTLISPASQWVGNLQLLPGRWLAIFLDLPQTSEPIGKKTVLRLGAAIVLSMLPFFSLSLSLSLSLLKDTKSRMTRIVILYHWFLCAVLLFFFVFGVISSWGRRLIPLWFSCLLVDWLTMMWMLRKKGFLQTVGAISACLTALLAGLTAFTVINTPANTSVWERSDCIYQTLLKHGLTHGYSADYWYGPSVTVLSNETITSRTVGLTNDGFEMPIVLAKRAWYTGYPAGEKIFLICRESIADEYPWLEEGVVEKYYAWQYSPPYRTTDSWVILVYDHDVIAEDLREKNAFGDGDTQIQEN